MDYVAFIDVCNTVRFLEPEGMEKTCRIKQKDISQVVDVTSASKVSDAVV